MRENPHEIQRARAKSGFSSPPYTILKVGKIVANRGVPENEVVSDVFETPNVQAHMEGLRDRTVVGDKGSCAEVPSLTVYFCSGPFSRDYGSCSRRFIADSGKLCGHGVDFLKFLKRFRSSSVATRSMQE